MSSSLNGASLDWARSLASAAGLSLDGQRLEALALALQRNTEQVRLILAVDYQDLEPACRFTAPQP